MPTNAASKPGAAGPGSASIGEAISAWDVENGPVDLFRSAHARSVGPGSILKACPRMARKN